MTRTGKILSEYGYRPNKARGQNFLVKESVLKAVAREARIKPTETVVEIGPGPGNLTRLLAAEAKRVYAVEIEHELAMMLKAELKADNVTVIEADALETDFAALAPEQGGLKVVANLPYNITTPLLFKLLDSHGLFTELLLLVQKEVAQRIAARPGKKPYGILSVRVGMLADAEIALEVGPGAFSPRPAVDSALVRITILERPRAETADPELFKKVVKAAFGKRRKTIKNSLSSDADLAGPALEALADAGISPGRRAETVTIEEFAALADAFFERKDHA